MLIEFPRERRDRRTVLGVPAAAGFPILVGTSPQLTDPLVWSKNLTLPVTLTCSPRVRYMKKFGTDAPRPSFRDTRMPGVTGGDVAVENEKKWRERRAQFCKARMRVRDAGRERQCQTPNPAGTPSAFHRLEFPQ